MLSSVQNYFGRAMCAVAAEIERLVQYARGKLHYMSPQLRILPNRSDCKAVQCFACRLNHMLKILSERHHETLKRHDCNVARAAMRSDSARANALKSSNGWRLIWRFSQEDTETGLQLRRPATDNHLNTPKADLQPCSSLTLCVSRRAAHPELGIGQQRAVCVCREFGLGWGRSCRFQIGGVDTSCTRSHRASRLTW